MSAAVALVSPAPQKIKRVAAKRKREFYVEGRSLPSKFGELFGAAPGEWLYELGPFDKIAIAREMQGHLEVHGTESGVFFRGAEYRVRRTDVKRA